MRDEWKVDVENTHAAIQIITHTQTHTHTHTHTHYFQYLIIHTNIATGEICVSLREDT